MLSLRGGPWEVRIRPERGGRITSLRLRDTELLDQGIGVDDATANGFVQAGAWGWDEMVPNVNAAGSLPDHGEAWRQPWEVLHEDASSVLMRCRGVVLPWELERHLHLGQRVRVNYVYRNLGAVPQFAYWCAHPLFQFETGMDIGVPGGEALSQLAEGSSTKVFLPKGSIDRAHLGWRSGTKIELVWDAEVTPHVGVWACNGDLGGYRQVAIEPATGGNEKPDRSAPPPLLKAGGEFRWWLEIREARA